MVREGEGAWDECRGMGQWDNRGEVQCCSVCVCRRAWFIFLDAPAGWLAELIGGCIVPVLRGYVQPCTGHPGGGCDILEILSFWRGFFCSGGKGSRWIKGVNTYIQYVRYICTRNVMPLIQTF